MKWLLLSSATEIKVLNLSNHGQPSPQGSTELCHRLDGCARSGCAQAHAGAHVWVCCVCPYTSVFLQGSNPTVTYTVVLHRVV